MKTVGEMIRARREAMGMTLAAVANEAGLTKSYLSMIENHKVENPPSRGAIEGIERALGISTGDLMRAADWEKTPEELRERLVKAEEQASQVRELAKWLKKSGGTGKELDKLYSSGELAKRVNAALRAANGEEKKKAENLDAKVPVGFMVPLINKVAAGYPTDFTDLAYPAKVADEYVAAAGVIDPHAFAARVIGDSMLPDYHEGDIVVFSPAAKLVDGNDCFVRLEPDHTTTFKRVFFEKKGKGTQVRLQPLNPKYPATFYEREQIAGLYKAVWRMQKL
jgi:repressor LexA